jgi:hypothetical protein
MPRPAEPVMIPARCQRTRQGFRIGVRPVSGASTWKMVCAIPIREEWITVRQAHERQQEVRGGLVSSESYRGCPRCQDLSVVMCGSCGKFSCYDGQSTRFTCAWCGLTADIGGSIDSFSGNVSRNF